MMTQPLRFLQLILFALVLAAPVHGQSFFEYPPASPFNKKVIQTPDSGWSYSFLAGGHLYGAHDNARSVFPAASLLGNFKRINANPSLFFMATGDVLRDSKDPIQIEAAQRAFAGLEVPVFNAPGNHDLSNREAYEKAFGIVSPNTFFRFPGSANQVGWFVRDDYFMIIDTEYLTEGQASQLMSFLNRELERLQKRPVKPRHVFVFSHRLLWALCNESMTAADELANEPLRGKVNEDSACMVFNAVLELPHTGETYWISGDVGAEWSVPMLYAQDKVKKLHAIASGIGDGPDDALLKVSVNPEGKVSLSTLPLTNESWNPVESYTLAYWDKNESSRGDEAIKPSFFDKIKAAMGGEVFWGALGMGAVLGLLLARIFRRRGRAT